MILQNIKTRIGEICRRISRRLSSVGFGQKDVITGSHRDLQRLFR